MSKTHWKKLNNPDFLGAYALEPGEDLIATIKSAAKETFIGTAGKKDEGLVIHFMEPEIKPMIVNATNAKTISTLLGTPYVEDWGGHKIQLYSSEVSAFGETVDALRVRPFPPKTDEYKCMDCGAMVEPYSANGKDYTARQMAETARTKFGRVLCMDCAKAAGEKKKAEEVKGDVLNENNEN